MNKIIRNLICGVLVFAAVGCQQNSTLDEAQETYLEVSEEIVTLGEGFADKEVTVMTNAKTWHAKLSSDAEWLNINRSSDALILSAKPNEESMVRTAKVLVEADGRSVAVVVRQRGAATEISLSQSDILAPVRGGSYVINVSSSTSDWRVEGAELYPWVLVQQAMNGLSLQVLPNEGKDTRTAKIYVSTAGSTPVEVVVRQEGKSPYVLPYMPNGPIFRDEVLRDAQERGMFFLRTQKLSDTETIYHFNAGDKAHSTAKYSFKSGVERYTNFIVMTEGSDYGISPDFEAYLAGLGFEFFSEKIIGQHLVKKYVRVSPHYVVVAQVQVPIGVEQTTVIYKIEEVQPHPMKTFDKVPYRNTDLLNTADFFTVKKWEESEGECVEILRERGKDNPNVIQRAEFSSVTNKNTHVSSIYFFEEKTEPYVGKLFQKIDIYSNINLALWADSEGRYFVTDEMSALLEKAGFVYQGRPKTGGTQEWISFVNINLRMALLFTNVNQPDGGAFLAISFFKIVGEEGESSAAFETALKNAQKAVR